MPRNPFRVCMCPKHRRAQAEGGVGGRPPQGRTGLGLEEKGVGPRLPCGPLLGEQTQPRPLGALSDPTMKGSVDGPAGCGWVGGIRVGLWRGCIETWVTLSYRGNPVDAGVWRRKARDSVCG